MAEQGAHVTSTLQNKPSIFEVVASDSLNTTFDPAIKRLFQFLANNYPEKFGWTIRHYDEIYLILNGFIQQYYIRIYGGSLSEAFYGLTRIHVDNSKTYDNKSKLISFACIVILPYIRQKIENLLEKWKTEMENGQQQQQEKLKRKIIELYYPMKAFHDCFQIYQYIIYMADLSKSHTILLRLIKFQLTYLPPDEQELDWTWTDLFYGKLRTSTILTSLIFRGLELSAFFLQFIQWWQTNTNQGNITNLPVPEPPKFDINSHKYKNICPICLQNWDIPTVIAITGYVYCYKCIVKHFEFKLTCPATNCAASIEDLVRIYDE